MAAVMENNSAPNQEVVASSWASWIPASIQSKLPDVKIPAIDDFWDIIEQIKANFSHGILKGLEDTFQQVAMWVMSWQIWKSAFIQGWIRYFVTLSQLIKARIGDNFSKGYFKGLVLTAEDLAFKAHEFWYHPVTQDWIQYLVALGETCELRLKDNFSKGYRAGFESSSRDLLAWISGWDFWSRPQTREAMRLSLPLVEKTIHKLEDIWHGFFHHKWMPAMVQSKLEILKVEPRLRRLDEFVKEQAAKLPEPEQPAVEQVSPKQSPTSQAIKSEQPSMDLSNKTNGSGENLEVGGPNRKNRRSKGSSKNSDETATF